ncbi:MAG: DMT family transporter [Armatimonadetes bacterium]|nr:DMT family transporter [Armatimonadota bacterium]
MATQSKQRCPVVDPWLLSVAIIWGLNFVAYKMTLRHLTPLAIVGVRFGLMAPILLLVAWWRRPEGFLRPRHWLPLIWAGMGVLAAQQISFIVAVNWSSAAEAALLISTAPIFTAIIATGMRQEQLTALNWVGIAIGFAGVAMVVLGSGQTQQVYPRRIAGDLTMLFSALMYGYFMVLARPMVREHGGLRAVAYCYFLGALVIVPLAAPDLMKVTLSSIDLATWAWLVGYIVVLAGVYGFVVWYTTIGRTTAARTAVYQYLVPVVAMVGAAVFLGERPGLWQILGAATTLAGVAIARWPSGEGEQACTAGGATG